MSKSLVYEIFLKMVDEIKKKQLIVYGFLYFFMIVVSKLFKNILLTIFLRLLVNKTHCNKKK